LKEHKLFKKWDILILAAAVLLSAALLLPRFLSGAGNAVAVVNMSGEDIYKIDLTGVIEPYELELGSNPAAVIRVEPGKIRFVNAGCPDKLCVNSGWLSRPGDTAACLPAATIITVHGGGDIDAAAY